MTLVKAYCKLLLGTVIGMIFVFVLYLPLLQQPPTVYYNRNIELKGWEMHKSRNTSLYVRPGVQTVLMTGERVCPPPPLLLLIMVLSATQNFTMRRAIRETWGKALPPNTSVMYFVGKPDNETLMELLREEQATHQDLVQEDFTESYNNLTIASILMLKFIVHRCTHAQYILKADDDLYLNVFKLHEVLLSSKFPPDKLRLSGNVFKNGRVERNSNHKWYTPEYMFYEDVYPNYLAGCAYIMSRKVASTLYHVSLSLPLLHHEDVFITGICAKAAGIEPLHLEGISYTFLNNFNICNPWYIAVHRFTPEKLRQLWKPIEERKCNLSQGSTVRANAEGVSFPENEQQL